MSCAYKLILARRRDKMHTTRMTNNYPARVDYGYTSLPDFSSNKKITFGESLPKAAPPPRREDDAPQVISTSRRVRFAQPPPSTTPPTQPTPPATTPTPTPPATTPTPPPTTTPTPTTTSRTIAPPSKEPFISSNIAQSLVDKIVGPQASAPEQSFSHAELSMPLGVMLEQLEKINGQIEVLSAQRLRMHQMIRRRHELDTAAIIAYTSASSKK